MLEIKGLKLTLNGKPVIDDLNLEVRDRRIVLHFPSTRLVDFSDTKCIVVDCA